MMLPNKLSISTAPATYRGLLLFFAVILLSSISLHSQQWEYYYGGNGEDQSYSIIQTDDLGFIQAGWSESFGDDNDEDIYIVKTDIDGDVIWETTFDPGFEEFAFDLVKTLDGNYAICGTLQDDQLASNDGFLLKFDGDGNELFFKSFNEGENEFFESLIATSDGGYLMVGRMQSVFQSNVIVVKTDADGNEEWTQFFGSPVENDRATDVVEVTDGYVITGYFEENANTDGFLLKLDFDGSEIWPYGEKTIGLSPDYEEVFAILATEDNGFLVTGNHEFENLLLAKFDIDGNPVWAVNYPGNDFSDIGNDLAEVEDGYVVGGITELSTSDVNMMLGKFQKDNGEEIWYNNYGVEIQFDWCESFVVRATGGFALSGYSALSPFGIGNDVMLAKTDEEGGTLTNYLTGFVYQDNGNCVEDMGDDFKSDWIVTAKKTDGTYYHGTTNDDGFYTIIVDTGSYELYLNNKANTWEYNIDCGFPAIYSVTFDQPYDTIVRPFTVNEIDDCPVPYLTTDVSTPVVGEPCTPVKYTVNYSNIGPFTANDAAITVTLDQKLEFQDAELPYTLDGNQLTFELGSLVPGTKGSFTIDAQASCDSELGETFTVYAQISPANNCPNVPYTGPSIKVDGECDGDKVRFSIQNVGQTDLTGTLNYIVIEDQIMGKEEFDNLDVDEVMEIERDANGSTYRVIVDQVPGHPGRSFPTIAVEGCVSGSQPISKGQVTMFPEDEFDDYKAVDAQESVSNTDDLGLRGYPKGYRGDTIATNTDIDYHIFFQNTGTDTAFRVVIRDTLDTDVQLTSIRPGASSHPYDFRVYENGIVKFVFDDIVLPPSTADATASSGFVQFSVQQQPDLAPLTEIFNQPLLFIGNQAPVATNVKRHIIGGTSYEDFVEIILSDTDIPFPNVEVATFPNPFAGVTTIEIHGATFTQGMLQIFDESGRSVRMTPFSGNQIQVPRGDLAPGIYFLRLQLDGQLLKAGKVIVK